MEKVLSKADFILSPSCVETCKHLLSEGNNVSIMIDLLCNHFKNRTLMTTILSEWLDQTASQSSSSGLRSTSSATVASEDVKTTNTFVERFLMDNVLTSFDDKHPNVQTFLDNYVGLDPPAWLQTLMQDPAWQTTLLALARKHPTSEFLIYLQTHIELARGEKLSSEGPTMLEDEKTYDYDGYIVALRTSLQALVQHAGLSTVKNAEKSAIAFTAAHKQFMDLSLVTEYRYVVSQQLLSHLSVMAFTAQDPGSLLFRRLSQDLLVEAQNRNMNVDKLSPLVFPQRSTSSNNDDTKYPIVQQCLESMLRKNKVTPVTVSQLHKAYSSSNPPSARFLQHPILYDYFLTSLFTPEAKINKAFSRQYIFVLTYAATVTDRLEKMGDAAALKAHVLSRASTLATIQGTCGQMQFTAHPQKGHDTLMQHLNLPIVAACVMFWVDKLLGMQAYHQRAYHTVEIAMLISLLSKIADMHPVHRQAVLDATITAILLPTTLSVSSKRTLHKKFVPLLVHLCHIGYAIPVLQRLTRHATSGTLQGAVVASFCEVLVTTVTPPFSGSLARQMLNLLNTPVARRAYNVEGEKRAKLNSGEKQQQTSDVTVLTEFITWLDTHADSLELEETQANVLSEYDLACTIQGM